MIEAWWMSIWGPDFGMVMAWVVLAALLASPVLFSTWRGGR